MNYPALTTGLVTAPRGIGSMAAMFLVAPLINRVDNRLISEASGRVAAPGPASLDCRPQLIDQRVAVANFLSLFASPREMRLPIRIAALQTFENG